MASNFQTPITIKEAIDDIFHRNYLLPAIQRKFVWSHEQIEVLFDSIMREYPINSFMFWEVKEDEIKNGFKFYQFLLEYRERFADTNPDIDVRGIKEFKAIIDGQQRLTSLYIGLKGTYAYKLPRKWWSDCQENIPTRRLYLNLSESLPDEDESFMYYDFKFLTNDESVEYNKNAIWYLVNDILTFKSRNEIDKYIEERGWSDEFTKDTIRKLYEVVFQQPLITYCLVKTQEIDTVLDIFIRANSGGRPLSFSDLLMAITIVNWKSDQTDVKKGIEDVIRKVFEIAKPGGFLIDQNFILKTCLVLFNDNIKFRVKNFDRSIVNDFEQHWDRIKKSIIECFTLLSNLGFNNQNLKSKNAAIPIIYYIFRRGIESTINNPNPTNHDKDDIQLIRKWLCLSLLKGVFGGQSDTVLSTLRKVIKSELEDKTKEPSFPLDRIKDEFAANPTKNLSFSDDLIDGLLTTQKDDPDCFAILSLLSVKSGIKFDNADYHKDHLHPASSFDNKKLTDFPLVLTEEDFKFYSDPDNWNGIANLQLLNGVLNESKGKKELQKWVKDEKIDADRLLIPSDVSLEFKDFKNFIEKRKELLKSKLKEMVGA